MTPPCRGAAPPEGGPTATRPDAERIARPLLRFMRALLERPALDWAEPPTLLGDGVTARAFSLRLSGAPPEASGPLVCRVFCDGGEELPDDQAVVEAALQNALAGYGFPTPRAIARGGAGGALAAPFQVMERVPGRNAFGVTLAGLGVGAAAAGAGVPWLLPLWLCLVWGGLARLLWRLHAIPGAAVERSLTQAGVDPARLGPDAALDRLADVVAAGRGEGHGAVLAWLREHRPAPPVAPTPCHGDLWLGNVLVAPGRVSLIDWTQASLGHPEADLGWMSIQHYSRTPLPLPEPLFDWLWLPVRPFAWLLMAPTRFVYQLRRRVEARRLDYFTVFWALQQLAHGARLRRAAAPGAPPAAELRAWGSAHTVALLRARIRRITGLDPEAGSPGSPGAAAGTRDSRAPSPS